MTEHAAVGPSALHRLLACPGSHKLSASRPEKSTSVYAAEGTLAHQICEECLRDGQRIADHYLGDEMDADGFTFVVDEEMVDGCNLYIRHCRSLITPGAEVHIEQRVQLEALWNDNPPEPVFGTADFVVWNPEKSHMVVCDFKYGRKEVSPDENPQAMAYALGAVLTFGVLPAEVDIYVVQPRGMSSGGQGIKHWRTTGLDLMAWGVDTLKPGVQRLHDPDAPLRPGDHCSFCPALAICPALRKVAQETARETFSPIPPEPGTLSDEELAQILNRAEIIAGWIAAVRAEASQRIDKGFSVPGWKLVPKRAQRRFTDKRAAEEWARLHAPGAFKEVLETPTQIEKKLPEAYEALSEAGLIEKSSSGTTLVPDQDPREALSQHMARDEFERIDVKG